MQEQKQMCLESSSDTHGVHEVTGWITLYTVEGILIHTKKYYSKRIRQIVIDNWAQFYNDGCYYIISPITK